MNMEGRHGTYTASKAATTAAIQALADEVPVEEALIVSFHPGSVYTPAVKEAGLPDESAFPYDQGRCKIVKL